MASIRKAIARKGISLKNREISVYIYAENDKGTFNAGDATKDRKILTKLFNIAEREAKSAFILGLPAVVTVMDCKTERVIYHLSC